MLKFLALIQRCLARSVQVATRKRARRQSAEGATLAGEQESDSEGPGSESDVRFLVSRAETGVESELDGFEEELPGEAEIAPEPAGLDQVQAADHAGDGAAAAHDPEEMVAGELRERAGRGQHTIWPLPQKPQLRTLVSQEMESLLPSSCCHCQFQLFERCAQS